MNDRLYNDNILSSPISFDFSEGYGSTWETVYPDVSQWPLDQCIDYLEGLSIDLPDCDPGDKDRNELVELLESISIQTHDEETDEMLREAVRQNISDETLDGLEDYRDSVRSAMDDHADDFQPMMNMAYPITLRGMSASEAQTKIMNTNLCVVTINDETYLALTAGGMDFSWHICRAYISLGSYPPVKFCDLPEMAGEDDAETVKRCIESVQTVKGWMERTEDRLNALAEKTQSGSGNI